MDWLGKIGIVTALISSVAGYCDATTFVSADAVFSAHVTGNFILFAYEFVNHSSTHSYIKLLTFPVFVVSVMIGGVIKEKGTHPYSLLFIEGIILVIVGIATIVLNYSGLFTANRWHLFFLTLMTVFAMGLQNTFGKLFSKETHGPTTMMTGNVTQASLDLINLIITNFRNSDAKRSFKRQVITIAGFFVGAIVGAIGGKYLSLISLILPGMVMIGLYSQRKTFSIESTTVINEH